jgi:hypothetical protein
VAAARGVLRCLLRREGNMVWLKWSEGDKKMQLGQLLEEKTCAVSALSLDHGPS